jgi:DNA-binding transcriptional LysR family regulator
LDRLNGMEVFVAVVDGSGFAAAARRLGISPAMVSAHVKTLEKRLGVRLLNRTTRRVSATEVGQNYYRRCMRILAEVEEAERAACDLHTAPRGLLRVTASVSFGTRCLAPVIADYLEKFAEVSIELSLSDRYIDLVDGGYDLAIRIGLLPDSGLIARKLATLGMVLCASSTYLRINGVPRAPGDLVEHNCLAYANGTRRNAWCFFRPDGEEEVAQASGRIVANNGDALLAFALKDAGVIFAPDYVVEDELAAGRLIRLLPEYATQGTPVHAVYPHSQYMSAKTRTFMEFLASRFD